MDLLSKLPVAKALPAADFKPAATRESRDSRVEESGALSFSGLLARNQETTELKTAGGNKPAQAEDNGQGSQNAAAPAGDKSLLAAETVKIKLAQAAATTPAVPTGQEMPATDGGATLAGMPAVKPAVEGQATNEVQPTGGDGQGVSLLNLPGMKAGEQAPAADLKPAAPGPGSAQESQPGPATPQVKVGLQTPVQVPENELMPEKTSVADIGPRQKPELAPRAGTVATPARETPVNVPAQAQSPAGDLAAAPMARPAAEIPGTGLDQVQMSVEAPSVQPKAATEKAEVTASDQSATVEQPDVEFSEIKVSGEQSSGQQEQAATGDEKHEPAQAAQAAVPADTPVAQVKSAHVEAANKDKVTAAQTESAAVETSNNSARNRVSAPASPTTGRVDLLEQGRSIRRQVIQELSSSLDGRIGNEKITLQLNPEKLGQVEIQFLARGNDLSIAISASSNDAEQAIREGIKELAEGIADRSARWQQVDIKVDQRGQEQDKNDSRQDSRRDQSRRDGRQNPQQQQQHNQQTRGGGPDWASLRQEG